MTLTQKSSLFSLLSQSGKTDKTGEDLYSALGKLSDKQYKFLIALNYKRDYIKINEVISQVAN